MSAGLLLVTHQNVGHSLIETAQSILGLTPLPVRCLAVQNDTDPNDALALGQRYIRELDDGEGLLIFSDCFGSTPSNIAERLGHGRQAAVIAGINLPMLLRVLNYPDLSWRALQDKALDGGRDGVRLVYTAAANEAD